MTNAIALIFDMDGVIVDNMSFHVHTWKVFFEKYGFVVSDEDFAQRFSGRTSKDILTDLFQKELSAETIDAYTEEKEGLYRELYRPYLQPVTGLMAFLENMKKQGVKLAVATSAPVSNADFTLNGLGISHYFEVITDASYVSIGKPDPQVYLLTAQRLGMTPSQCVVFEDSHSGIQAGLRASMKVIGVATTHTAEELGDAPDLIIKDFTTLSLEQLQTLLAG